jgi:poly-gamma-glutamate capsule biosynthesis protein CapA/YwtB (metallophosphatase superfamily)
VLVVIRRLLATASGCLALRTGAACTTAPSAPRRLPSPRCAAGIDLVTMANNHVLDYGSGGLANTLAAARAARFGHVGIGASAAAAWAPYLTTINGVKIAMVGVSQVVELASSWVGTSTRPGEANAIDLGRTLAAVRSAKRQASVVIVFMHWGTEGQTCPDQAQLSLAHKLAAAGASIIVGAHAHMLQALAGSAAPSSPTAWATSCGGSTPTAPPPES